MTFCDKFRSWLYWLVQMSIISKDISVPGPNRDHRCFLAVSLDALQAPPVLASPASRLVFELWMASNGTSSKSIILGSSECNKLGEGTVPQKLKLELGACGWSETTWIWLYIFFLFFVKKRTKVSQVKGLLFFFLLLIELSPHIYSIFSNFKEMSQNILESNCYSEVQWELFSRKKNRQHLKSLVSSFCHSNQKNEMIKRKPAGTWF